MIVELRARRIIKALRKDWYSFDDLNKAIRLLRLERDSRIEQIHDQDSQGPSSQASPSQNCFCRDSAENLIFAFSGSIWFTCRIS